MRARSVLTFVIVVLSLLGCKKSSRLIGAWNATTPGISGTATFNPDGKFQWEMLVDQVKGAKLEYAGKYHESGDNVYLTYEDVQLRDLPPDLKAQEPAILAKIKGTVNIGTEMMSTCNWSGTDSFTINEGGKVLTFKKK